MGKLSFTCCRILTGFLLLCLVHATWPLPAACQEETAPEWDSADLMVRKKEAMQHFQLAKNFHMRELYEAAIREYHKALDLNPDWEEARQNLMWAKKDLELKNRRKQMQRVSLPDIIQSAQEYYERGRRLETTNDLVEAALAYKKAVEILADYPEAKQALARVQRQARDSLVLDGTSFRKRRLAESAEMDQWQNHRKNLAGLESKPAFAPARPQPVSESQAATPETHASVSQAIQSHFLAGSRALDNNDWNTAIHEFHLVLEFMPDHKKAAYKLEIAKERKAGQIRAIEKRAAEAASPEEKIKAMRALTAIDPGNTKNMQAWEKTRKENPQLAEQLYHKGVACYAQGDYQEALQNWQLVLDLMPHHKKAGASIKKVREKLLLISDQQ